MERDLSGEVNPVAGRLTNVAAIASCYMAIGQGSKILDRLAQFYEFTAGAQVSWVFLLCGPSGVGKSSLISRYLESLKHQEEDRRLLYVEVPAYCTSRALASSILEAMGDPLCKKGSANEMEFRIKKYVRDLKIGGVVLDEFHRFIDRDKKKVLKNVVNSCIALLNKLKVAFIFAGLPQIVEIVAGDDQLRRRTLVSCQMEPFRYSNEREREEFQRLVLFFADRLTFANADALASDGFCRRLCQGSKGLVGLLIRLLTRAALEADMRRSNTLDIRDFWEAFEELRWSKDQPLKGISNPFSKDNDDGSW